MGYPPNVDDRGGRDSGGETLGRNEGLEEGDGGGLGSEHGCTEHGRGDKGEGEGGGDWEVAMRWVVGEREGRDDFRLISTRRGVRVVDDGVGVMGDGFPRFLLGDR